jgi:hypothetical protein
MSPRVALAIWNWQPAPEGSSWNVINLAWLVLVGMIEAAEEADRKARH